MNQKEVLSIVDHTLLGVAAEWEDIREILDDGIAYGCASAVFPERSWKYDSMVKNSGCLLF